MKEGFVKDYMRSRVVAQTSLYSLFRKVEPYEEKFDKDCSRFTEEEILEARIKIKELKEKYNEEIKKKKKKALAAGGLKIIGTERHYTNKE